MRLIFFEMALDKKDLERKLQSCSPKIIEHLLYLMLSPNCTTRKHWKQEIYSFLNDVTLIKGSKKNPKAKFIYDNTYGYRQDLIMRETYMKKFLKDVCAKENISTNLTITEVQEKLNHVCEEYFTWLSNELSENLYVTQDEVYEKIDEILADI